jgi:hypothetical protein
LHAAVAGYGDFASGTIGARDELPARSSATQAILKSHAHSIRLRRRNGKVGLWESAEKEESRKDNAEAQS